MPSPRDRWPAIRDALADRYGPGAATTRDDDPTAAILAVVLGRSIDDRKVAPALDALRDHGLIEPEALAEADPSEVVEAVRSAGAKLPPKAIGPLKKLARWVADRGADTFDDAPTDGLRDDLIAINGVGPATADAVLLQALDRPVYPVDRATYRVFARHGWLDPSADYEEARSALEGRETDDPAALRRLSWWMERVGSEFCRASRPKCERCPLRPFLPEGGPIEPDAGGE